MVILQAVASRVIANGNQRWVEITESLWPDIEPGTQFRMVGNNFAAGGTRISWLGVKTGRPATKAELAMIHAPYDPTRVRKQREGLNRGSEVDDDEPEESALEAFLEQQHSPQNLLDAA